MYYEQGHLTGGKIKMPLVDAIKLADKLQSQVIPGPRPGHAINAFNGWSNELKFGVIAILPLVTLIFDRMDKRLNLFHAHAADMHDRTTARIPVWIGAIVTGAKGVFDIWRAFHQ